MPTDAMTAILFLGLLVLAGVYLPHWLVGLPFYPESYRPRARGFHPARGDRPVRLLWRG